MSKKKSKEVKISKQALMKRIKACENPKLKIKLVKLLHSM